MRKTSKKVPGQRVFFPAAALHAALILPLSMANLITGWSWPPGLRNGHGAEMLFGFVPALIVGYLLGPQPRLRLFGILALWAGARLAALVIPGSAFAALLEITFVLASVWLIVPKLLAAKKWRNRSIAPLVLVLFLLPVLFWMFTYREWSMTGSLFVFGIILLSLLMLFMGGRLIAATAAGEIQRQGGRLAARVQPTLEAGLIILLASAATLSLIQPWQPVAGVILLATGAVAAVRQFRWRLWLCRRSYLIALGVGHFWLVIGLFALGLALLTGTRINCALHIITVGALGTLSITIAARVHLVNLKQAEAAGPFFIMTSVLIVLAVLLRVLGVYMPTYNIAALWLAAAAWSLAYLLLLALLLGWFVRDNRLGRAS